MNSRSKTENKNIPSLSPARLALRRLLRNKIAITGAVTLTILYFLAVFAGFLSPYSPTADEFRDSVYHPPTPLHFGRENGSFSLRPYVVRTHLIDRGRILYAPATPLYVQYSAPEANVNLYIPDSLQRSTPILTVLDSAGRKIGVVHSMQETDGDSVIFSAIVSVDPIRMAGSKTITIQSYKGESNTFPIMMDQQIPGNSPDSAIRLTNVRGQAVNSYYPEVERYSLRFFVKGWKYRWLWFFQSDLHLFGVESPCQIFLFGTDQAGRDIFSRVLYGAQISLSIGLVGVLLTTFFGMLYGGMAGYYGGSIDHWMMRIAEIIMSIPALYLILALRNVVPDRMQDLYDRIDELGRQTFAWQASPSAFFSVLLILLLLLSYYNYRRNWKRGPLLFSAIVFAVIIFGPFLIRAFLGGLDILVPGSTRVTSGWTYFLIILMLSAVGWAAMSRVIRGMVLSLREQEYVVAAKALGASDFRVLTRHILPNTIGYVIVRATLLIPAYILGEVALSFLGVGVQEPSASWGNMLSASQSLRVLQQFTWSLTPGFFLFLTVLAYNFLGDGLRDAFDPRSSR